MAITTYTTLQTAVGNYLSRDDLTDYIPDFVRFAEERLSRDLRVSGMQVAATSAVVDNTLSLPSDFLEMTEIHLQVSPNIPLSFQPQDIFFRNGASHSSGEPNAYTIVGSTVYLSPQPSGSYTVQMVYYAKPDLLSDTNPTNLWVLSYPDALLYATLAEAEPFLMNDERIQVWASMYDRAIGNILSADRKARYPSIPMAVMVN